MTPARSIVNVVLHSRGRPTVDEPRRKVADTGRSGSAGRSSHMAPAEAPAKAKAKAKAPAKVKAPANAPSATGNIISFLSKSPPAAPRTTPLPSEEATKSEAPSGVTVVAAGDLVDDMELWATKHEPKCVTHSQPNVSFTCNCLFAFVKECRQGRVPTRRYTRC